MRPCLARLPKEDLVTDEGAAIAPAITGAIARSASAGMSPLEAAALPRLLERWAGVYGGVRRARPRFVALAAAHQRLGWIHPFIDGNGRVMRLHTHLLPSALGWHGRLWSQAARLCPQPRPLLQSLLVAADEPRRVT